MGIASRVFSAGAQKQVHKYGRIAKGIAKLEDEYKAMSDDELRERSDELRDIARAGEKPDYVRDHAMALLREHIRRMDGRRAYDVQIIAALALWDGDIIESETGSGKTLISHFPAYLSALYGRQCHIVTVNEYLTQRDADEANELLSPLGYTVGRVYNQQPSFDKKRAYDADIVYGTPSEFGFDYLRDNMVNNYDDKVQKEHEYVIIDEVDSILIDEAKTPLIISGAGTSSAPVYQRFAKAVRGLIEERDYLIEEDKKLIATTEDGLARVESRLGFKVFDDDSGELANHLMQALKAEYLYFKDKDYIISNGEVKIVDPNTGRVMEGRRWSEGLHQAIEAKEGVKIQQENQTIATITLQNYFRLYKRIAGMTGTALTEATEFRETYGIETVGIPSNKPRIRIDAPDVVYLTADAKYDAVADEIEKAHAKGQPVLAGTISVENSERLSALLRHRNIPHVVLNAKQHAKEAEIVAQAGRFGAVTIATNMAGRGTDIMLGGNVKGMARQIAKNLVAERLAGMTPQELAKDPEAKLPTDEEMDEATKQATAIYDDERPKVIDAGGLYVIGTERHEARRIDNQLRGRSGRQGDPGRSQFFISLDDDLLHLFGDDNTLEGIRQYAIKMGLDPKEPLQAKALSKTIESTQHKIEEVHYEQRKNTLEYDDVINKQRKLIYSERDNILKGANPGDKVDDIIYDEVTEAFDEYATTTKSKGWDSEGLAAWYASLTGQDADGVVTGIGDSKTRKEIEPKVREKLRQLYDSKIDMVNQYVDEDKRAATWAAYQRQVMLAVIDMNWQHHLSSMDYLKTGIGLRGVGQRDPKIEYKREAKRAFDLLVDKMYSEYLKTLLRIHLTYHDPTKERKPSTYRYSQPRDPLGESDMSEDANAVSTVTAGNATRTRRPPTIMGNNADGTRTYRKDPNDPYANVGRNDPCPCGSGKKFKYCHGRMTPEERAKELRAKNVKVERNGDSKKVVA